MTGHQQPQDQGLQFVYVSQGSTSARIRNNKLARAHAAKLNREKNRRWSKMHVDSPGVPGQFTDIDNTVGKQSRGYTNWEVSTTPVIDYVSVPSPRSNINPAAVFETQILVDILAQQYSTVTHAGPGSVHIRDRSFLQALLSSNQSSLLLERARATMSLSHLASQTRSDPLYDLPLRESYARLVSRLRVELHSHRNAQTPEHHRQILAAIVVLSLVSTLRPDPTPVIPEQGIHLMGAADYLVANGPNTLDLTNGFDLSLFQHIHTHAAYSAFTKRIRLASNRVPWGEMPRASIEKQGGFAAASRFLPFSRRKYDTDWVLIELPNVMHGLILPLTELLERSDTFCANNSAANEDIVEYEYLVKALDDLQTRHLSIQPLPAELTTLQTTIIDAHAISPNARVIEEDIFMCGRPTFRHQYAFGTVAQAVKTAFYHQMYLIADCALLQTMYCAFTNENLKSRNVKVDMNYVERRAHWHASEICRCTHFYSHRFLTAAQFLNSLLRCAGNFFECCAAAAREAEWCRGCIAANEARIARIYPSSPPTLCRITDVAGDLPKGCRYGPLWADVASSSRT